jgi:hypothetical protein
VDESRQLLQPLLREDVVLETELDPVAWPVLVDASLIQQVILNLAVNARDAMPDGGRLVLSTRNLPADAPALARLGLEGPHVAMEVRDTGSGIPPAAMPHIFEPFFTTKPPGEGTGLGLATVYGIVSQLGGRVDVSSAVGEGTCVAIYLPCARDPVERPRPAAAGPVADHGHERILVVEDDPLVRELAVSVLRSSGYEVRAAATPSEAIELAAAPGDAIQLLLTDEVMPGMSGRELAKRLRSERPGLRVLRVSGYSEGGVDGDAVVPGSGSAFLPKPYTPAVLREQVRRLLDEAIG